MNYYNQILLILLISTISCTKSDTPSVEKSNPTVKKMEPEYNQLPSDECIEYVALWSAGEISEQIGKDKKWVFLNYTVDIWDIPPEEGKGRVVAELRASSYAPIFDSTESAYLVESPMGKVKGWLDKSHVKSTLRKNKKTKKICND